MNKPRDIVEVINQIIEKVPIDNIEFRKRLQWVMEDSYYKAPELMWISWERLQEAIIEFIPPEKRPKEDWECEILSIFSTIPVNDIKDFYANN